MTNRFFATFLFLSIPAIGVTSTAAEPAASRPAIAELKKNGISGNPVFEGWYADPEAVVYGDEYWIYPTYSDDFDKQTYFDAFSSKDLVYWTKHPRILTTREVKWAKRALWAPAALRANGRYYFFFSANDIHGDEPGGIGVAVADRPEGPFVDALDKPLIGRIHNRAQPIDQCVFRDDDGRFYMYYGGWGHCIVVRLSKDLLHVEKHPDGTTYKEITPENYVEGPYVFKRGGKYYLMWSEGGWTGPDYSVAYAMADSPLGPFRRIGKILQQNPKVGTGAGHHSVIPVAGSDTWYIVYHRHPLGDRNGNHREVCIDEMRFNSDGTIRPVKITVEGVKARQPAEPEKLIVQRDVVYGKADGKPLKLDVLRPRSDGKKLRPAVIYIHGGAWKFGDKGEGIPVLKPLVETGNYVGFTVAYRLSGTAPWPVQIHDCKAAVRWVRANAKKYRVDPDRIGVCGVSAGGHLVNMLGVTGDRKEFEGENGSPGVSSRVQCVVNNCGPTDLPHIGFKDPADDDILATLMGGPLKEKAETMKAASPIYYVHKGCPPFLHLHGTKDPIVNFESQAVAFHKALKKAGVDSTLVALDGGGHPAAGPEADRRLRTFFDKHLLGKAVEVSAEPIRVK